MAADYQPFAGIDLDSFYDCSDLPAVAPVSDDFSSDLLAELAADEAEEAARRYANPQDYAAREAEDIAAFHRELAIDAGGFDPA